MDAPIAPVQGPGLSLGSACRKCVASSAAVCGRPPRHCVAATCLPRSGRAIPDCPGRHRTAPNLPNTHWLGRSPILLTAADRPENNAPSDQVILNNRGGPDLRSWPIACAFHRINIGLVAIGAYRTNLPATPADPAGMSISYRSAGIRCSRNARGARHPTRRKRFHSPS